LLMLVATIPAVSSARFGIRAVWRPRHPAVRELLRLSGWTMGYVAANQVALYFVLGAAKRGDSGDVTAYTLANSVFFQLPHGVIAVSLISAVQPTLSRSFLHRNRREFRSQLASTTRTILVFMTPAAVGYALLASPIAELVLAHGNSTVGDAQRVADVLRPLAIGLPAFSIYLLYMSALKALRDTRATFEVNAIENAINIVVGAFLYVQLGVVGLGMAFAIAYIISVLIAGRVVSQRTVGLHTDRLVQTASRVAVASAAMAAGVLLAGRVANNVLLDQRSAEATVSATTRFVPLLISIMVQVAVGALLYLFTCRLLGVDEVGPLIKVVRKVVRKLTGPAHRH
jgi:putative peptidoglycan lipid II flippase